MKPTRAISPKGTYFITTAVADHKSLFQVDRYAELLVAVLNDYASKGKFELHSYVIMPDHIHLILTPAPDETLEKCIQLIKGGSSFRLKKELGFSGEVWQRGFTDHRIRNEEDLQVHKIYLHQNPVRRGLSLRAQDFRFSSAFHTSGKMEEARIRNG